MSKMSEETKKSVGRPKITTDQFPEGWQEHIVSMGAMGCSDVEIRGYLNCIAFETWERLLQEDEVFLETVKKAQAECESWWQMKGRTNLENKDFSATLWYMNMKNRFGWADKKEIDHTSGGEQINAVVNFVNTNKST